MSRVTNMAKTRGVVHVALAIVSTLLMLQPSAVHSEQPAGPVDKLKKAQRVLKPTNDGIGWLSRAAWTGAILKGSPDLSKVASTLDKVKKPVAALESAVTKLVEAAEDDEDVKSLKKGVLSQLKVLTLRGQVEALRAISKKIREMPVGLVSEKIDEDFRVSADLLIDDKEEAERRFAAYVAAMEKNAEYLTARKEILDEFVERAEAAAEVVESLKDATEKAVEVGLFTEALIGQYLDLDALEKEYRSLRSDAAEKVDDVEAALEEEERRIDNLRTSLKTLFGFDV